MNSYLFSLFLYLAKNKLTSLVKPLISTDGEFFGVIGADMNLENFQNSFDNNVKPFYSIISK